MQIEENIIDQDILERVKRLPDELIDIIHTFIPKTILLWLNRENYYKYHSLIYNSLRIDHESLVRYLLRSDLDILFSLHLRENLEKWTTFKKYLYKKKIYKDYITFIWEFAQENSATKCKNVMMDLYIDKYATCKNKYKNNTKYPIWRI
jgi:hypothetical protein